MKALKEKKGFTLVELLAVIVVLGIVMVLATTTVLPLLEKSQKNAIVTEANALAESASQAVSLISIDSYDGHYEDTDNGYCFELNDLESAGLWKKTDSEGYEGRIIVTKSGNKYSYDILVHNSDYTVTATGNATIGSVSDYDGEAETNYGCPTSEDNNQS